MSRGKNFEEKNNFLISEQMGITRALLHQSPTNPNWEGTPAISQIDKMPYLKRVAEDNILSAAVFSVKWNGWIAIPQSGTDRFVTTSEA